MASIINISIAIRIPTVIGILSSIIRNRYTISSFTASTHFVASSFRNMMCLTNTCVGISMISTNTVTIHISVITIVIR